MDSLAILLVVLSWYSSLSARHGREAITLRDIRSDLQERLALVSKERADLEQRKSEIDQLEAGIRALLQHENQGFVPSANGHAPNPPSNNGGTDLARFLLDTLRDSGGPLSLDELKDAAEAAKFDFGEKRPGRVLHWALVGMAQSDGVEKVDDKWRIKEALQETRAAV